MPNTSNLVLPLLASGQAQKHVTVNESLFKLDGIVQLSVISQGLNTPPVSPTEGNRYIAGNSPTDTWSTGARNVWLFADNIWNKLVPRTGWMAWVEADGIIVIWTGSAWTPIGGIGTASFAATRWDFADFHQIATTGNPPFVGEAVASGTISAAITGTALYSLGVGLVQLSSSTTANGGYRIQTVSNYRNIGGFAFRCILAPTGAHTGVTMRLGFHDSVSSAAPVDGIYFEVNAGVAELKASRGSTVTTGAGSLVLSLDTMYTFDIDIVPANTSATGLIKDAAGTLLFSTTVMDIPNTAARLFNAGLVATEASTTARAMCVVDYMGLGPRRPLGLN